MILFLSQELRAASSPCDEYYYCHPPFDLVVIPSSIPYQYQRCSFSVLKLTQVVLKKGSEFESFFL